MKKFLLAGAAFAAVAAAPAGAQTLTFEGVGNNVAVGNFYNGGAGGNLGIEFVNAFGLVDADDGGDGNFANEPSSSTTIYFTSGTASTMNVAAGFTTGFSFFYTSSTAGSVQVFDGLNGAGNLLATIALVRNIDGCAGDPTGGFCRFSPIGVTFDGTARSVFFGGVANQVGFDNITLGAEVPGGAIPEPATWAMMIAGFGMVGGTLRRRSTKVAFA